MVVRTVCQQPVSKAIPCYQGKIQGIFAVCQPCHTTNVPKVAYFCGFGCIGQNTGHKITGNSGGLGLLFLHDYFHALIVNLAAAQHRHFWRMQDGRGDGQTCDAVLPGTGRQGITAGAFLCCHQDELFALAGIRNGKNGILHSRPDGIGHALHLCQRNHLPGDFGKALGAAQDTDKSALRSWL